MPDPTIDPWGLAAVEQNRHWLTAFLLAATGDRNAAEDIVQDVFRIAYEKRGEFAPGTNFGGWLRAIAQNCLKRHFDKSRRSPILVGDALHALEAAATRAEGRLLDPAWSKSRMDALRTCLNEVTRRAREILRRRFGEGRSADEVADGLGMSVTAVNVTVYRARRTIADCVRRKVEYEPAG
jgi:RNA polymerase sigma-70 factor (ECF subfamily)